MPVAGFGVDTVTPSARPLEILEISGPSVGPRRVQGTEQGRRQPPDRVPFEIGDRVDVSLEDLEHAAQVRSRGHIRTLGRSLFKQERTRDQVLPPVGAPARRRQWALGRPGHQSLASPAASGWYRISDRGHLIICPTVSPRSAQPTGASTDRRLASEPASVGYTSVTVRDSPMSRSM